MVLILFHERILEKFTRYVCKRKTSPLSPCVESACEMLRFSHNERKNYRVTFISGGKSRPTLAHKFTNHARLCVKFTRHIIILVLIIHVIIFSNVIGAALATLFFSLIILQRGNRTVDCNQTTVIGQLKRPVIFNTFSQIHQSQN